MSIVCWLQLKNESSPLLPVGDAPTSGANKEVKKRNTVMTPSSFYLHPVLPNVIENPRLVKLPPLPSLPPATTQHFCPAVPPILCHQESTDNDGDHGKLTDEDFANQLADLKKTHGHLSLPRLRRIIMRRQKKTKVKQFRVVSSLLLYLNF